MSASGRTLRPRTAMGYAFHMPPQYDARAARWAAGYWPSGILLRALST